MPVSLSEALKKSPYELGTNFEKLGKKGGIFARRILLDYDDKAGWKVRRLHCFQLLARWVLGAIGSTHLQRIAYQLRREDAQLTEKKVAERIWSMWNRAHPKAKIEARPQPMDPKQFKEAVLQDLDDLKGRVDSPHFKAKIDQIHKVVTESDKVSYISIWEIEPKENDPLYIVQQKREKLDALGASFGLDFAKLTQLEEEREQKMILSQMESVILQLTALKSAVKGNEQQERKLLKIIEELKTPEGYDSYCFSSDLKDRIKTAHLHDLDNIGGHLKLTEDFAQIDREFWAKANKRRESLSKFHAEIPILTNWDSPQQLANVKSARQAVQAALNALGRQKSGTKFPLGAFDTDNWTLNFGTKKDEEIIQIADSQLTVGQIRAMQQSVKVRFLEEDGLDKNILKKMLTDGATAAQRDRAARWRCVGSDVYVTHDINGTALKVMPKVGMYNMSAPELVTKPAPYFNPTRQFQPDLYHQDIKKQLGLFLFSAQADGRQIPILSGFGQLNFLNGLTPKEKGSARAEFARAFVELVAENDYTFEEIVFAEENPDIRTAVEKAKKDKFAELKNKACKISVNDKPPLEVARCASLYGFDAAILNAGDPSCYPGQFWEGGHVAQDEAHGLFTTFVMAQHLPANESLQKEWDTRCIAVKLKL